MVLGLLSTCCPCLAPCFMVTNCASCVWACFQCMNKCRKKLGIDFNYDGDDWQPTDYTMGIYPILYMVFLGFMALAFFIAGLAVLVGGSMIIGAALLGFVPAYVGYIWIWYKTPFDEPYGGFGWNKIYYVDALLVTFLGPAGMIHILIRFCIPSARNHGQPHVHDIEGMRAKQAAEVELDEQKKKKMQERVDANVAQKKAEMQTPKSARGKGKACATDSSTVPPAQKTDAVSSSQVDVEIGRSQV